MERKKYVFLILHYNAIDVTQMCIESILKLDNQEEIAIVLVDNASPNGTGRELKMQYCNNESIHVLLNENNEGFSKGNNYGYEYIKSKFRCEYVIVANNDIEFIQADFLAKIEAEYLETEFVVLGPDVWNTCLSVHQNPLDDHIRSKQEVKKTILLNEMALKMWHISYPLLKWNEKRQHKLRYENDGEKWKNAGNQVCLMGACLIFSKDYIRKNDKIFSPETYFYYEEYILALRCKRNHWKMVYNPELVVNHREGSSTNSRQSSDKEKQKFKMKNIISSAKIYLSLLEQTERS